MYTIFYFKHGNIALIIHVFHNVQSKCGSDKNKNKNDFIS